MRARWSIAGVSVASAVLLPVGVGGADADELSDLRAQMASLRQRIDQMAQMNPGTTGGTVYGTQAVPGAGVVGGSFPRSFLIPGTRTSIRIGGVVDETPTISSKTGRPSGLRAPPSGPPAIWGRRR